MTETNPSQRRYPPELKDRAVRMVTELRQADPNDHGVIARVARQLGVGEESLRTLEKRAEIDAGRRPGLTSAELAELKEMRKENRELRRANDMAESTGESNGSRAGSCDFRRTGREHIVDRGARVVVRTGDHRSCCYPLPVTRRPVESSGAGGLTPGTAHAVVARLLIARGPKVISHVGHQNPCSSSVPHAPWRSTTPTWSCASHRSPQRMSATSAGDSSTPIGVSRYS